jgi:energy-coupling factor transport system permease protein
VERAATITAAQRARGLDTEGSLWRRLRGVLPLAGPVLLGSITEVEERTMAFEARGFTRPGRRTLLWWPSDSGRQRLARWLLLLAVPALVIARAAGWLGWLG